jgi:hypothetical protein
MNGLNQVVVDDGDVNLLTRNEHRIYMGKRLHLEDQEGDMRIGLRWNFRKIGSEDGAG